MEEILLYGKRDGEIYEELVAVCKDVDTAERLKPIAAKRFGLTSFRISVVGLDTPPDFAKTLNV